MLHFNLLLNYVTFNALKVGRPTSTRFHFISQQKTFHTSSMRSSHFNKYPSFRGINSNLMAQPTKNPLKKVAYKCPNVSGYLNKNLTTHRTEFSHEST